MRIVWVRPWRRAWRIESSNHERVLCGVTQLPPPIPSHRVPRRTRSIIVVGTCLAALAVLFGGYWLTIGLEDARTKSERDAVRAGLGAMDRANEASQRELHVRSLRDQLALIRSSIALEEQEAIQLESQLSTVSLREFAKARLEDVREKIRSERRRAESLE